MPPTGCPVNRRRSHAQAHYFIQLVLVVENYHVIEAAAMHAIVQLMLDYPPPGLVMVLVSQSVPPLELARLRVRRQMVEVS